MKKVLFIDRDGILFEEPHDEQIDSIDKVKFLPGMLKYLSDISAKLDYKFVMVTNQDGLGTQSFPESDFWPIHELLLRSLRSVGVVFEEILIDRSFPGDNSNYRKPNIGMLTNYLKGDYDIENSFVIGDRWSDMQLAANLGCKSIWLNKRKMDKSEFQSDSIVLITEEWKSVFEYLMTSDRESKCNRITSETSINGKLNLDGSGLYQIDTGIKFFDHMLVQIVKHGNIDLFLNCKGDLEVDQHHTIEDVAIVLGQLVAKSLSKKAGINRYGFALPMDDCTAQVMLDFGGRPWIEWDVSFRREMVGDMPTEMVYHFFKSFSDHAKCNLNIKSTGENEHHKIESIFKAFAKTLRMSIERVGEQFDIPSTKGIL